MGMLTILKKIKEQEREIRILVLGLDNAGKTTIVKRFCGKPIDEIEPTLGFQIETLEYDIGPETYQLHVWDIGGQSTIRAYWRNYFEKTDGIVWVVDSCDRFRLDLVKEELDKVLEQERLAEASLLVLANKSDLSGSLKPKKIAKLLDLQKHCGKEDNTQRRENETEQNKEEQNNNNNNETSKEYENNQYENELDRSAVTVDETNEQSNLYNDHFTQDPSHSSRHWTIRSSSAVTGEGLREGIDWLVRDIADRIYFMPSAK